MFQDYFLRVAVSYGIPINVPVVYLVRYVVVLYINFALCTYVTSMGEGGLESPKSQSATALCIKTETFN